MKNSLKLIKQVCAGQKTERTPIFDLLCNDAVVAYYAGEPLNGDNDMAKMFIAAEKALDGTRCIFPPMVPGTTWTDGMGNIREAARWTSWIRHHALADADAWVNWIKKYIERLEAIPAPDETERMNIGIEQQAYNKNLNGTVNIFCTPSTAINTALFGYCGLEIFSYLWEDEREMVLRWMRALEKERRHEVMRTAHYNHSPLVMIYSDVAYKQHLMFSHETFNDFGFFDDVADICAQCHQYGMTVIFHSDGYIMDIIDDLVACGIDGLNPIEKAAGMDIYEIHRKYPELILVGGLDVTHLLPFATPDEVRTETRRMIDEIGADGKLLIGSSTEMEDNVPLANYLAFHDEVMGK